MEVVDLRPDLEEAWLACLEPWNPEATEGRAAKLEWYEAMKGRGLLVKLALEGGAPVGMIQCVPIEESPFEGRDLYAVLCIWVHGHKRGIGNWQGRGIGSALLSAAEAEARQRGARGMAAWGLGLPVWMRASWFRRHGYRSVDRQGMAVLVFKRFAPGALPPCWPIPGGPPPRDASKTSVTCFSNGWCNAQNAACARAQRAAASFGDAVAFQRITTRDPAIARRWGQSDAVFIDQDEIRTGPPPTEKKLRRLIGRKVHGPWWRRWRRLWSRRKTR